MGSVEICYKIILIDIEDFKYCFYTNLCIHVLLFSYTISIFAHFFHIVLCAITCPQKSWFSTLSKEMMYTFFKLRVARLSTVHNYAVNITLSGKYTLHGFDRLCWPSFNFKLAKMERPR